MCLGFGRNLKPPAKLPRHLDPAAKAPAKAPATKAVEPGEKAPASGSKPKAKAKGKAKAKAKA